MHLYLRYLIHMMADSVFSSGELQASNRYTWRARRVTLS
jgi:hypothetical protein